MTIETIDAKLTADTKLTSRYLEEVLLQPEQVNEVVLTAAGPVADEGVQHPHGDY